jgi:hypothetical protein
MNMKHLSAFAALVTLSLAAACSSGSGGVVPGASGVTPDGVQTAAAPAVDTRESAKTSPIKVRPASLTFSLTGAMKSKRFTATEAKYHGTFRISSSCHSHVAANVKDAKGPEGIFTVTPVSAVEACTITVIDSHKNRASVAIAVKTGVIPTATPSTGPSPTPTSGTTASPSPGSSPTPSAGPSASPSAHPSTSPSAHPTATPTATSAPTATPTSAGPTPTPGTQVIANGNFSNGLTGWTPCSYVYTWPGPVNASPAPLGTPAATPTPASPAIASGTLGSLALVTAPPADLNPNNSGSAPAALGSTVALLGDPGSENKGVAGICQTFTVDSSYKYLSFWAWEGGAEYNVGTATQEADILDSTASTVLSPLFVEQNCFWDPGVVGQTGYLNNGCIPSADGGASAYSDWQGGYWVQRGPYDFSAYVGQTVTLFLGVWDKNQHGAPGSPTTYGNEMFVGNVQFSNTNSFPSSYPFARHRAPLRKTLHPHTEK